MFAPRSLQMASQTAKVFLENVLDKVAKLLMEEAGLRAREAVAEADNLWPEAFNRALDSAMEMSDREAVQCDWLVVVAGRFLWVVVCEVFGYCLEDMPPLDLVVPDVPAKGDDAFASLDHLERIRPVLEKSNPRETFTAHRIALKKQRDIVSQMIVMRNRFRAEEIARKQREMWDMANNVASITRGVEPARTWGSVQQKRAG